MQGSREVLNILIVSSTEKSASAIAGLLARYRNHQITIDKTGNEVRRRLSTFAYDLVIINTPLSDEFGMELALDLTQETTASIVLLVKNEEFGQVFDEVAAEGVLTVAKPISPSVFEQAVYLAVATRGRLVHYEKENSRLKQKLEEAQVIGRAKCALIAWKGMSEAQAHRYIEKQAMDTRSTRKVVAEIILKTYEG